MVCAHRCNSNYLEKLVNNFESVDYFYKNQDLNFKKSLDTFITVNKYRIRSKYSNSSLKHVH